jgi:hypothetical protein
VPSTRAIQSGPGKFCGLPTEESGMGKLHALLPDLAPGFIPSEFVLAAGFLLGGGSDGSWRGALGIAQRQIPARVGRSSRTRTGFFIRAVRQVDAIEREPAQIIR